MTCTVMAPEDAPGPTPCSESQINRTNRCRSIRGPDDREAWAIRRRRHVLHVNRLGLFSLTKISTGGLANVTGVGSGLSANPVLGSWVHGGAG